MLLTEGEADLLQVHLEGVLQRLCDADSVTMAEYVVALLKHDKSESELRALCFEQLEEFLRDETAVFIDTLFKTIASREFLNNSITKAATAQHSSSTTTTAPTASNAVKRARDTLDDETPATASHGRRDEDEDEDEEDDYRRGRRRKRNVDEYDPINGRDVAGGGAHGGLQGVGVGEVRPIESFYYDDHQRDHGTFNKNMDMGERGVYQQRQSYGAGQPQQMWGQGYGIGHRGGFRGGQRSPMGMSGMSGMRMHQGGGVMGSAMIMGVGMGMGIGGLPPRIRNRCYEFDGTGHCSRGETCRYDHSPMHTQQPMQSGILPVVGPNGMPFVGPGSFMMSEGGLSMQPTAFDEPTGFSYNPSFRGRGRGRGGRGGGYSNFPNYLAPHRRPQSDTLIVENIPVESCTLDTVNEVFKPFGTIIDIKIEPHTRTATVRYSRVEEAKAAHGNSEAYFGNRFVKVFFAPPPEEAVSSVSAPGQAGQVPSPSVAAAVASHGSATAVGLSRELYIPAHIAAGQRKAQVKEETQTQYEAHLKAQKDLLHMLLSPAIKPDRKAELLTALKSIEVRVAEGMEKLKQFAEEEKAAIDAAKAKQRPISAPMSSVSGSDMDKAAAASGSMGRVCAASVTAESAVDEVAELEALKAQAAAAGLDPNAITSGATETAASATGSLTTGVPILRGGFRGGRAGVWRGGGRGGARPVAFQQSFSLDLRTKKLRVHGASEKDKVILMQQFQGHGQVVKLDFDEAGLIIEFQARHHAEKALSLGVKDGNAASLKLEWYEDSKSDASAYPVTTANAATSVKAVGERDVLMDGELAS